jgi:hypothetical protein
VAAALRSSDVRTRRGLADLLRDTDHPALLLAVEESFADAVRRGPRHLLWTAEGRPAPLLEIALANPRLPRPCYRDNSVFSRQIIEGSLLALLCGRRDLLARYDAFHLVRFLLDVICGRLGEPFPRHIVAMSRWALRDLPAGSARESLCSEALAGNAEARAAVVDGCHLPADPARHLLFLYCTDQWERYDALDPHGRRLRRSGYSWEDWCLLYDAAKRGGRRPPPEPRQKFRGPAVRTPYRPGGSGTAGSGGFSTGGGYGI